MHDAVSNYLKNVNTRFKTGISTEHTFRGDFQSLVESLQPNILATNEPTRVKCGAPDFILTQKNIPVGYVEAKDIGKPLDSKDYKEQFDRYRRSLAKLIITDYLDFWFYQDGELVEKIAIGEISGSRIKSLESNFGAFTDLLRDFCTLSGVTIQSAQKLSKMMAGKARLLARIIESALTSDEENEEDSTLKEQMTAFQKILIHDIQPKDFADIYAQSIAYGMFAARLHDPTLDDFSRQEAGQLIPKSNPFLRKLFQYIAGYDLDDRIVWIVDALADIFRATDVKALMENFGKSTEQNDPVIHFYETFLAEYDPKLRKSRGVWYTPEPVVNFIVRAVDDILKKEFGLSQGLADTTKTKIQVNVPTHDKRAKSGFTKMEQEVHKVQILDPATGTGTFLAEVVKQIYQRFKGQQGIWTDYVENHLIPRLNGFEILMASYAMAHLKLELLLNETGFRPKKEQRLRVYLTNSLEEHHPDTGTLWANWLATEANEANHVKRDTPIMVVLGNPPYNKISKNTGKFIVDLIEKYKYVDGKHFKERKHWLNDDYVKFIRYAEWLLKKNKIGLLAFINNNGFLDNPTFRGMRQHLTKSFNKIYIVDLFGDGNYKGDENVFDIKKSVSINIFIQDGTDKNEVKYFPLQGNRKEKYKFLYETKLSDISFTEIQPTSPYYFFKHIEFEEKTDYNSGFKLDEIFVNYSNGMVSGRDAVLIKQTTDELKTVYENFHSGKNIEDIRKLVDTDEDSGNWQLGNAIKDLKGQVGSPSNYHKISYRPFDIRYTYFTGNSGGYMARPLGKIMSNYLRDNYGLVTAKRNTRQIIDHFFITSTFTEAKCGESSIQSQNFPLYTYNTISGQYSIDDKSTRIPNLNMKVISKISSLIAMEFCAESTGNQNQYSPIDVLDYIYAVLYSPTYRTKYKEFLKIDFSRIPYPKNKATFKELIKYGSELRNLHLLESSTVSNFVSQFPVNGDNVISKRITKNDIEFFGENKKKVRIYINEHQYFDNIPLMAWEFSIGGYNPARKWLKDRFGRQLSFDDIMHYQKIIVALHETDRIMKEIDKIDFME